MYGKYKNKPSPDVVMRILSVICGEDSLQKIANFYPGDIAQFLIHSYPNVQLEDAHDLRLHQDWINENTSFYTVIIFCITSTRNQIKQEELAEIISKLIYKKEKHLYEDFEFEEVEKHLTKLANVKIKEALDLQIIIKKSKDFLTLSKISPNFYLPFDQVQKHFEDFLLFSEPEYWDVLDYFTKLRWIGCSKEAALKALKVLFFAFEEAINILEKSESKEISVQLIASFEKMSFSKPPFSTTV